MNNKFTSWIMGLCALAAFNTPVALAADSDAEIIGIVEAANTAEINAGRLAQSNAQNAQVKQFAQHMVKSHTKMNADLAKNLQIKPVMNDKSEGIRDDALESLEKLKGMQGKEFDKEYIDGQVKMHEKVLEMMTDKLIPKAQNPNLKAALNKAAPEVKAHLEKAKQLQSSM